MSSKWPDGEFLAGRHFAAFARCGTELVITQHTPRALLPYHRARTSKQQEVARTQRDNMAGRNRLRQEQEKTRQCSCQGCPRISLWLISMSLTGCAADRPNGVIKSINSGCKAFSLIRWSVCDTD